jgi:probable F420-dependent oxidoreductase
MHVGVVMFPTDRAIQPVRLAREVEARGLESLWFPEHSHIPVSRKTPWPGGSDLPEMYWRTHDQFVALAAAAAATERIRLGTGICLVAQRDPIWLAKEVASLDTISNGRVILGVGFGWNREEMAHHGVDYAKRRALVREKILAMKRLWTQDVASYEGELVRFEPSWAWPKPVQKPHPKILLGGGPGPKMFAAVAEYADGWMPIDARDDVFGSLPGLRDAWKQAGRSERDLELDVFGTRADGDGLARLRDQGVARAILGLPPAPAEAVLPLLDRYAEIARKVA